MIKEIGWVLGVILCYDWLSKVNWEAPFVVVVLLIYAVYFALSRTWQILKWAWTTFWYIRTETEQGPLFEPRWQ